MPDLTAADYMKASDDLVGRLEKARIVNAEELEAIRQDLVADVRKGGRGSLGALSTQRFGNVRVIVPDSKNLRRINLMSEKVKGRFSDFRVKYLSKDSLDSLRRGSLDAIPKDRFIRYSQRLNRQTQQFLKEIREEFPDYDAAELDAISQQLEDNKLDLVKLETKSWTRFQENLLRSVQGRQQKAVAGEIIDRFNVEKNLCNLSLAKHPEAVTRDLLARSSEIFARAVVKDVTQIPQRAFVFVSAGPGEIAAMGPRSRAAGDLFRVFSAADLDAKFAAASRLKRASFTTWRGLGLGFNTPEWYIPIPTALVGGVREILRERRAKFIKGVKAKGGQRLKESAV